MALRTMPRLSLSSKIAFLLFLPLAAALVEAWSMSRLLDATRSDAAFINAAGRQRMLSVELLAWARMVAAGQDEDREGLRARISKFAEALSVISTGGTLDDFELGPPPAEVLPAIELTFASWRAHERDLLVVATSDRVDPEFAAAMRRVEQGLPELKQRSDGVVTDYVERTRRLRSQALYSLAIELVLTACCFLVGVVVARRVVVRPIQALRRTTKSLQRLSQTRPLVRLSSNDELADLGEDLSEMSAEIQRLLEALEARRRYAETLYQSIPIGMLLADPELRVVSTNASLASRCDAAAIVGRPLTEVLTFSDAEKELRTVLETGATRNGIPGRMSYSDQQESAPARISISVARPQERGQYLLVAVEDLTEEERKAEQLRLLQSQFKEMVESATDSIIGMNRVGVITHFNGAAERAFGYTRGEVVGRPVAMLMPERFRSAHEQGVGSFSARAAPSTVLGRSLEIEALRSDGTEFPAELTVSLVHGAEEVAFLGVLRDATRRRAAEEALRRSEQSFRALIERSPDVVAIHREGLLEYVNPAGVAALGFQTLDELVGRPAMEFVPAEDRATVASRIKAMMDSGAEAPPAEERFVTRTGAILSVEVFAVPVVFAGRTAFAVFARDVSERKRMASRMMQIDRLAAMGTLAAGVGHEINNPLSYVLAHVDHVIEALPTVTDGARFQEVLTLLTEAREGLERIRKVVKDLRTFANAGEERRELVDVQQSLAAAESLAWNEIRHRARVVHDYSDVAPVLATEARLTQVFVNLLVNAAQSIPEGRADANEIRISTRTTEGRVEICIGDTGSGIEAGILSRIFDPFFTTKAVGRGTGLGLSIVRSLVASLGGEVTVESEVGRGSKFLISLPCAAQPAVTPREDLRAGRAPSAGGRAMVLIVDDETRLAKAIARVVSGSCDAEVCGSGAAALELLGSGRRFDAIVCDLMMPQMTGMELFERLEAEYPELAKRTVFLTGGAFTEAAKAFLERVPNPRLDKPFETQALLEIIHGFGLRAA
ncbi:MAG: PAS domain S-box protein [Deltaproteobacteria bacterium]|nr:PAS domain S-box protein [Deltaproteobacteria bacterium]